jgi:hypothetical protein
MLIACTYKIATIFWPISLSVLDTHLQCQTIGLQDYNPLTVINPNTRIAGGLPILDMRAETHHYAVSDPYGRSYQYYMDHYLCVWEVTSPEIIGH